jgi:hypothetical protein
MLSFPRPKTTTTRKQQNLQSPWTSHATSNQTPQSHPFTCKWKPQQLNLMFLISNHMILQLTSIQMLHFISKITTNHVTCKSEPRQTNHCSSLALNLYKYPPGLRIKSSIQYPLHSATNPSLLHFVFLSILGFWVKSWWTVHESWEKVSVAV